MKRGKLSKEPKPRDRNKIKNTFFLGTETRVSHFLFRKPKKTIHPLSTIYLPSVLHYEQNEFKC